MTNISGSPFLVKWIGNGPTAQGQVIADQTSGPKAKTLEGVATIVEDGANTTFTVGWIDGTQKIDQVLILLSLQSVTAAATVNGVANQAIYSGVGSFGQIPVGTSVTIAGFTNAGNNGTFTVNVTTANTIVVTNSSSVAETNYAATLTFLKGPAVVAATIQEGNLLSDTSTGTLTAAGSLSSVTNAGMSGALSGAGTSGHTKTVLFRVYVNS
jgi:hypothetical protein